MVTLYEYQKQYLTDLKPRAIMAADTGTGKTFMALAHYERHASGKPLLILAPAAKVRAKDWEREIAEWFEGRTPPHYEIYSYEKFSRNPSLAKFREGARPLWYKFRYPHASHGAWAIIADECHRAKNPQSGIGKALYNIAWNASFFVGLSATPLPNGWVDFANYSKIWGFVKHITEFRNKYINFATYVDFPKIDGYNNVDELKRQWGSISKRLTKEQALDLPERTFIGVNFDKPAEYTKVLKERKAPDGTLLDNAPLLAHALRQTLTKPKLDYLADLLEGTNENVVIFYNYISERQAILDIIERKCQNKVVYRQDGERHELPSKENWPDVKNSITLAQFKSGSTGVEMTYATQVVYFSPTYSYADYVQSIGRVHRNGQLSKTTFYNFRTPGTIEQAVYAALRNKSDFQVNQWKGTK